MDKKKAVGYVRVSRMGIKEENWDQKESPHVQRDFIKKFCEFEQHELIGFYEDLDRSGKDDNREQFKKMMEDMRKGDFDLIVVYKLNRFSRKLKDIGNYLHEMDRYDVSFVSSTEPVLRTDTHHGRLMIGIMGSLSEFERDNIAENVHNAMKSRAIKGLHNGGFAPIGYKINEENEYIIDEEEAPVVKRIFNMYLDGKGKGSISRILTEERVLNKQWPQSTIHEILINPKYMGKYIYNRRDKRTGRGRYKDENEWVLSEKTHEPIISEEVFEKVQKERENRGKGLNYFKPKNTKTYILGKMIRCGKCGSTMTGRTNTNKKGKVYRYYSCSKKDKMHSSACSQKMIRQDIVDTVVLNEIKKEIDVDNVLERFTNQHNQTILELESEKNTRPDYKSLIEEKEKEIKKIDKMLDVEMEQDHPIQRRIERLREELVKNEKELIELKEEKEEDYGLSYKDIDNLKKLNPSNILKNLIEDSHEAFLDLLKIANKDIVREVLNDFISSVIVEDMEEKRVRITINFKYNQNTFNKVINKMEKLQNPVVYPEDLKKQDKKLEYSVGKDRPAPPVPLLPTFFDGYLWEIEVQIIKTIIK